MSANLETQRTALAVQIGLGQSGWLLDKMAARFYGDSVQRLEFVRADGAKLSVDLEITTPEVKGVDETPAPGNGNVL